MEKSDPLAVRVLNKSIVLWWDKAGSNKEAIL